MRMDRKLFLGLVFSAFIILAAYWLGLDAQSTAVQPGSSNHAAKLAFLPTESLFNEERAQTQASKIDEAIKRRPLYKLDVQRLHDAYQNSALIKLMEPREAVFKLGFLTEAQKHDGRVFVSYDPYIIESKLVGDTIQVLIPQIGLALEGQIQAVEVNGDILRWTGSFTDLNDMNNRFSITQTMIDRYTHAVYETPFGHFNMEVKNEVGWVIKQSDNFQLPENGTDALQADTAD